MFVLYEQTTNKNGFESNKPV